MQPVSSSTGGEWGTPRLWRNMKHVSSPQEMGSARTHDTSPPMINCKMAQSPWKKTRCDSRGATISQQES